MPIVYPTKICSICEQEWTPTQAYQKTWGKCVSCRNDRMRTLYKQKHPKPVCPEGKKRCSACQRIKELSEFPVRSHGSNDGHASHCKQCHNQYREDQRRTAGGLPQKNIQEGVPKGKRRCCTCHQIRDLDDFRNEKTKYHSHAKTTKCKYCRHPFTRTQELNAIRKRDTICYICEKPIGTYKTHFDHVTPLARGGSHKTTNLRLVHAVCNQRKKSLLLEEMPLHLRTGPL